MVVADPTLDYEAGLHAQGARYVIGCDEVGRGAIAGPVGVGLVRDQDDVGHVRTGRAGAQMPG